MIELKQILAKPEENYISHIKHCMEEFEWIWQKKLPVIKKICSLYKIDEDRFYLGLLSIVAFHDIGKCIDQFQQFIRGKLPTSKNYRHELASMPVMIELQKKLELLYPDAWLPFETLTVLTHHRRFERDMFHRESSMKPKYIFPAYNEAIKYGQSILKNKEFNASLDFLDFSKDNYIYFCKILLQLDSSPKPITEKDQVIFSLMKGIFKYADWYASGGRDTYSVDLKQEEIEEKLKIRAIQKQGEFKGLTNFQRRLKESSKNVIVRIPTGKGKTEGAIFWALNKHENEKIIYLLPTMVTSNKIYQRLGEYFGKEKVGLAHGTASYFLKKEEKWEDQEIFRKKILSSKCFMKPVTVATVDQLLYAFFNWRHWELIRANAMNARIILDEIHTFDAYTTSLICEMLRQLKECGTKFTIMSATMSTPLILLLKKVLGNTAEIIEDPSYEELGRNNWRIEKSSISEAINNIYEDYSKNKKILVVLNRIAKAQALYKQLKSFILSDYILLLHSEFILKDRNQREDLLDHLPDGGFVLVSTQVVEVSLDIDFDVLYTQIAPIESLIQRAGRVNRYGKKNDTEVIVFQEEPKALLKAIPYEPDILTRTEKTLQSYNNQMIKEKDFSKLIEEIYGSIELEKENKYRLALENIRTLQRDLHRIMSLDISDKKIFARINKYIKIDVIPSKFRNEINKLDALLLIEGYRVKIPLWLYHRCQKENYNSIEMVDVHYDFDLGVIRSEAPNEKSLQIY